MSYQFKAGDKGKTRDGRGYEVICQFKLNGKEKLLVKIIEDAGHEVGVVFGGVSGMYHGTRVSERNGCDLIQPTIQRTVWMNVYEGSISCHPTEEVAKAMASFNYKALAVPVTFQYKEDSPNE